MKKNQKGLCVADIKRKYKEQVYHTYLLRRSYREDGKVKQQTLANLTPLPDETREIIRESLKGRTFVPLEEAIEITRSSAHGHVAAARKMAQDLGLAELICAKPCRERDLVEAMVLARLINPQTKLATTRWWHTTTLPEELGVRN
ncbi:MAG TPA: hypothetical protein DCQ14_06960 [Firmicutes bacterium]|nr:hypothetical protein [Bacillota bacterium]